jgi:transketolase
MDVWRPCDSVETALAWQAALEREKGPTALLLSRQNLGFIKREKIEEIRRGGYVLSDAPNARAVVIATGSEVQLALGAARDLEASGVTARVVSMPCCEVFDAQPEDYRASVLPDGGVRLAIEAGATGGWWRYVGERGDVIGIDRFGHSAPGEVLFEHFGFTVEAVVARARGRSLQAFRLHCRERRKSRPQHTRVEA